MVVSFVGAGLLIIPLKLVKAQVAGNGNPTINSPLSVIDVTAFGAKADAKVNRTASMATGSPPTLTISSTTNSQFESTDVGKSISVNGAGIAAPTSEPAATLSSGSGGLSCGMQVYFQITYITESNGHLTSEGPPASEAQPTPSTIACPASVKLSIPAPTGAPTAATGWVPYVSYLSGKELKQAVLPTTNCTSGASLSGYGCLIGSAWSSGSSSTAQLLFDSAQPPVSSVLLTTISGYASATQVTLTDQAVQAVSANGNIAWGTDNSAAIANAIKACPQPIVQQSPGGNIPQLPSNRGCVVYFPAPPLTGLNPQGTVTGRYFIASGIMVMLNADGVPVENLTLSGGGSFGSGDNNTYWAVSCPASTFDEFSGPFPTAQIVAAGRFPLITFGTFSPASGPPTVSNDGLNIINLGFGDVAGTFAGNNCQVGNTWGAVRLINITHPYVERLNATNFGVGYGIELEGDPSTSGGETQIGTILNSTAPSASSACGAQRT